MKTRRNKLGLGGGKRNAGGCELVVTLEREQDFSSRRSALDQLNKKKGGENEGDRTMQKSVGGECKEPVQQVRWFKKGDQGKSATP